MARDLSQFIKLGNYLFNQNAFLDKCKEQPNGCITINSGRHRQGYRMVCGIRISDNKHIMQVAHRVSMMFKLNRELDHNEFVIHTCSDLSCVNPAHLIIGNYYTKNEIMIAKGNNHNHQRNHEPKRQLRRRYKWSDEQIRFARTNTTSAIVREYNMSRTAASKMRYECCRLYRWLK
jgi:hypothetical protein